MVITGALSTNTITCLAVTEFLYLEMKNKQNRKRNIQNGHLRQSKVKIAYKQAMLFHASPLSGSSLTALVKPTNAFSVSLACNISSAISLEIVKRHYTV